MNTPLPTNLLARLAQTLSSDRLDAIAAIHDDLRNAAMHVGEASKAATSTKAVSQLMAMLETMSVLSGQLNAFGDALEDEQAAEDRARDRAEDEENGAAYGLGGL